MKSINCYFGLFLQFAQCCLGKRLSKAALVICLDQMGSTFVIGCFDSECTTNHADLVLKNCSWDRKFPHLQTSRHGYTSRDEPEIDEHVREFAKGSH